MNDDVLQIATRVAYGTALAKLGKNNGRVIGMDGDTKNSTFSVKLKVTCVVSVRTLPLWAVVVFTCSWYVHIDTSTSPGLRFTGCLSLVQASPA